MKTLAITAAAALLLGACATTQHTSGDDYLSRGTTLAATPASYDGSRIDADIARIAAVEPDLQFPARIGLAHIRRGQLAAVPPEHLAAWSGLRERIEPRLGEVVPISPLIAQMVARPSEGIDPGRVVDTVRRGAARQHVDYVLIYETNHPDTTRDRNGLSAADLSIIGLFVLPSRDVSVEAMASAVLLDVRNGYPYGTASGVATREGLATRHGARSKERKLASAAEAEAVRSLARDVDEMLDQLTDRLATARTAAR